jgi:hypothetical protein
LAFTPVGALVELSTGEVAIVVAQSRTRRLRPTVLVLLDENKEPCRGGIYIVLEEITHSANGSKLDIVEHLEPNACDIDMTAIKLQLELTPFADIPPAISESQSA